MHGVATLWTTSCVLWKQPSALSARPQLACRPSHGTHLSPPARAPSGRYNKPTSTRIMAPEGTQCQLTHSSAGVLSLA